MIYIEKAGKTFFRGNYLIEKKTLLSMSMNIVGERVLRPLTDLSSFRFRDDRNFSL